MGHLVVGVLLSLHNGLKHGCSSIGRATVSKTVGCGFDSYLPCLIFKYNGKIQVNSIR